MEGMATTIPKRDTDRGRGMESRGTGSVSEEGLVPLRMDIDRQWKEAEEENPDLWLAGKGVQTGSCVH